LNLTCVVYISHVMCLAFV